MKRFAAAAGVIAFGLAIAGCSSTPDVESTVAPESSATPEVTEREEVTGSLENPIPFGESYVLTDLGEDAAETWEVTVGAPVDRTAEVLAFHDGVTGFEDEYPADATQQVVDVTITRLGAEAASPGDDLEFALTVDGIEEGLSSIVFTDGPRFRLLDPMQPGTSIDYPLVFTVSPGEVGAVVLTSPSETVYFG